MENQEWRDMSITRQIVYILLDIPVHFVMKVTIPPADEDSWDRAYATICPVGSTLFVFLMFNLFPFELFPGGLLIYFVFPLTVILSFAIFCNTHRKKAPSIIGVTYLFLIYNIIGLHSGFFYNEHSLDLVLSQFGC